VNGKLNSRRDFLKKTALGSTALSLPSVFSSPQAASETASAAKTNIILIMADDLGYECLKCNGSQSYKTPILDEMARTGVRFQHCHSQPLCTPSRVQIMTGQYNSRNYLEFGVLDPKQTTFAHILKKQGYKTCVAGKWQLWREGKGTLPQQAGFDEHCLWQVKDRGTRYANPTIQQNGVLKKNIEGQYGPDISCRFILDYIERNQRNPFFVYFPMALTHAPFEPTPDSPEWKTSKGKKNNKHFADMVAYMDKIVGKILHKLDNLGLREQTLVLFTGDNGTPRTIASKVGDQTIQGGKGLTIDTGTHVPLIASWKGTALKGTVCDDLIDFTDILPTLLDAAKIKPPTGCQ